MKKHILYIATIIAGTFIATPVFATTMDANVNIRPSMTLSVSTNDINLNLNPATKPFDTKDLTITIGTNNPTGYKLYLTSDSTNLVNTKDSSKTIETLPSSTPASGYDQASFPANYWGYRKSNGSSSSGNYLPFSSNLLVSSSTGPSNETTTSIGLASKIDYLKESGTYTLNFKLNAVPTITQYYMQDLKDSTLAQEVCVAEHPTIVFDSRDDQAYSIRRINGRCWMAQNLRFGYNINNPDTTTLEIYSETTNISTQYTKNAPLSLQIYNINKYGSSQCANNTSTGGYVNPCMYSGIIDKVDAPYSEFDVPTVWYNYAAASAGTIAGAQNTSTANYDLCPAGWRLSDYWTEIDSIVGTDYLSLFEPTHGGHITHGGVRLNTHVNSHGIWGRSVNSNYPDSMLGMSFNYNDTTNIESLDKIRQTRSVGYYIRCILKES